MLRNLFLSVIFFAFACAQASWVKKNSRVKTILRGRYVAKRQGFRKLKEKANGRLCLCQPNLRENVLTLCAVAHLAVTLKAVAKHFETVCKRLLLVHSLCVVQIVLHLFHNLLPLILLRPLRSFLELYTYCFVLFLMQR